MVNDDRQVPTASASAWAIHLEPAGGPVFVVMLRNPNAAREALAHHLVEIGAVPDTIKAGRLADAAPIRHVAVVW